MLFVTSPMTFNFYIGVLACYGLEFNTYRFSIVLLYG